MDIKLDHYKIFYEVSKEKSFSKAADNLYLTQSAVSQTIKGLEQKLGVKLFLRNPKGIQLTQEGKVLETYISQALTYIEDAQNQLEALKKFELGELKIAVGDTISKYYLLPFLRQFQKEYPNVKLNILNRTTRDSLELLKSGTIDFSIVNLPIHDSSLNIVKCKEIHDIFVGGNRFQEYQGKVHPLSVLKELPLIFLESNSNSRKYVQDYLKYNDIEVTPEIELGSHDLLLDFAKINLGVSCVIKEYSSKELEEGSLFEIRLDHPVPKRNIGICTLKKTTPSLVCQKFIDILLKEKA